MNKQILLFLSVFILFSTSIIAQGGNNHYKVYLLGGQSNAAGRADATELQAPYNSPQSDVKFYWHKSSNPTNGSLTQDTWIDLQPGSGHGFVDPLTQPVEFGSELSFGRSLANESPNTNIAIIKYAQGNTTLGSNWAPNGQQYNLFINTVNAALTALDAQGFTYDIAGMWWVQGESDTGNVQFTNDYQSNLTNLIQRVRSAVNNNNPFPFVITGLSNSQFPNIGVPAEEPYIIKQAQQAVAVADPLVGFVETNNLGVSGPANIHYNASGQISLGLLVKDAMVLLQTGAPPSNPTSFQPDPNKIYYLDVPEHNRRLSASSQSERPSGVSTTATNNDVKWKFINNGNGTWHIHRATDGPRPRLRSDNGLLADMHSELADGVNTYFEFTAGSTPGTHFITLPDAPGIRERLHMTSNGGIHFVGSTLTGPWNAWRITEAPPLQDEQPSFIPDPNKVYYLDVPVHGRRLAASSQSERPSGVSTTTTSDDVKWKFVNNGNGTWHIERAADGQRPRLRSDNSLLADMQDRNADGVNTYFEFTAGTTPGTHFITLPDAPGIRERLHMTSNGGIHFVGSTLTGPWNAWRITEAPPINQPSFIPDPNKVYYLDVPVHGLRLAASFDSEKPFSVPANTNNNDVKWRFINNGNGAWFIQRAAGGQRPRLRSDNLLLADLQDPSVNGDNTFYRFDTGTNPGTHFITLPAAPGTRQRLHMTNNGAIHFVSNTLTGAWNAWRITEAPQIESRERALESDLSVRKVFGQKTNLQWYFLQNNDHKVKQYLIKHSTHAYEKLKELVTIEAKDVENLVGYEYLHQTPVVGTNFYQVVVQFEDGTENYQMIEDITFDKKEGVIHVAPNPASDYLMVDLSKYMNQSVNYFIQSIDGSIQQEGELFFDHEDIVKFDLSSMRNGMYLIYLQPKNRRAVAERFVIAKDY